MAQTSFGRQLRSWSELTGESMDDVARGFTFEISREIINRTPVDTGRLRGNWQATINTVPSGSIDRNGASAAITDAGQASRQAPGNVFYLTNNLPYAQVAEFGLWGTGPGATNKTTRDGYSIQAPYGMVRVSVAAFQQSLARHIRNARARQRRLRGR